MGKREWLANEFERFRPQLRDVAYRMLGSLSEAEDAVQETWLRLDRSDSDAVDNVRGWLTVAVGRISLDMLRARRSRREDYAGTWLPEPIVTFENGDPQDEAQMADSIGLALLAVLDTLSPAERVAFVLHDMFGVRFDEIGEILSRSELAARQLASRARRRIRGVQEPDVDLRRQREVVDAFLAASRSGSFDALIKVLDPEVVFRIDTGAIAPGTRPPIQGVRGVADEVLSRGPQFAHLARPAVVNGAAGLLIGPPGNVLGVVGFTIVRGRVAQIDIVADPAKLRRLSTTT
jgi:RNA polymerase sigma factor (sigma-70 family)